MTTTYDLFLSHNKREKPWVRQLVRFLRARGLQVFFDADSIQPGEDVVEALEKAIEASKLLVLVISRSSVLSKWVNFEAALRIYDDLESRNRRLIPILVEPVDRTLIKLAVRRLDAVDLTDPETRESEFVHFLNAIGVRNVMPRDLPPWPDSDVVEELYAADINSVTTWGWSGEELLDRLIALDYQLFHDLIDSHEGHSTQWAPVFMDHPETWRLIITPGNAIIGYWHFVPLFEDAYKVAASGELLDSSITTDKVKIFEFPGDYDVYFVSIGLMPRYRKTKAFRLLLHSLFDVLLTLARDGIFIRRVCANAYTDSGVAMCKTFAMSNSLKHRERGEVYESTMLAILQGDPCSEYAELRRLYVDHYSRTSTRDDDVRSP